MLYRLGLFNADKRRPQRSEYTARARGLVKDAMRCDREGMPSPEAFACLITTLNDEFESESDATLLIRIKSFAISAGTPFKPHLPKYKRLVTDIMHGDPRYFPRQDNQRRHGNHLNTVPLSRRNALPDTVCFFRSFRVVCGSVVLVGNSR